MHTILMHNHEPNIYIHTYSTQITYTYMHLKFNINGDEITIHYTQICGEINTKAPPAT